MIPYSKMIDVLTQTADRLENGAAYAWSHQGNCNCGHLAQTVTRLSKAAIHARALEKAGDWRDKIVDYCPTSDFPIDHIITTIFDLGFSRSDLSHLERLSSPEILRAIPPGRKPLRHNVREDVILYLRTWAEMLEKRMLADIELPQMLNQGELALFYVE